jgi:hypothetical protein
LQHLPCDASTISTRDPLALPFDATNYRQYHYA